MLTIIPAIDLKDGKCVRLRQGRADDVTVYGDDPVTMAKHWEEQGGRYLHVVDLDGAFRGKPAHAGVVAAISEAIDIPLEIGGGIRTDDDIRMLLDAGADRVIIGTRALAEPDTLRGLAEEFGRHLVVGIDARDGLVQVKGWVETTDVKAVDLAADVSAAGVQTVIYTDTATDGMLQGVNAAAMAEICDAVGCDIVASGGVSSVEDITRLVALGKQNLVGAIVGKALYEGTVNLPELIGAAE